jgi:hypothetical protein
MNFHSLRHTEFVADSDATFPGFPAGMADFHPEI